MLHLRRMNENRTTDVLKQIVSALRKEGRSRRLVVGEPSLTKLEIWSKDDPEKSVILGLNLMNSNVGEVILTLDNRTWKMGDTFIRDRKLGGQKRPDMLSQVKNILDLVEYKIEEQR